METVGSVYLLGIGGIGMSALARYYRQNGATVSGYDKTPTQLTDQLISEGIEIHFEEDISKIPVNPDLVIMTPAIPADHKELIYLREKNIEIRKRSEILGLISRKFKTIAVAGTHGKTTTSTLIAHILTRTGVPDLCFLGGISNNYDTNFLFNPGNGDEKPVCVVEADEFDRSFLQIKPDIAIITSVDADHLDIYSDVASMRRSFEEFTGMVRPGGCLIVKQGIKLMPALAEGVNLFTYSVADQGHFHPQNTSIRDGHFHFDLVTPAGVISGMKLGLPGRFNLENAVAGAAAAWVCGLQDSEIADGLASYSGVRRRFDFHIRKNDLVYIDDYAHHPEELRACIDAVRELYPGKKITGIFQPHLFTRTRDFAAEFALILGKLDRLILLEIYPAREKPIPGIDAKMLLDMIPMEDKLICRKTDVINELLIRKPEVLLTLGAGDIDQLVIPITQALA